MTNTDILLEWSAKFVGIKLAVFSNGSAWCYPNGEGLGSVWNPLENISHMVMVLDKVSGSDTNLFDKIARDMNVDTEMRIPRFKFLNDVGQPYKALPLEVTVWAYRHPELLIRTIKEVVENE